MRAAAISCFVGFAFAGCAGPTGLQLRADTEDMGTSFGYLQQRQILFNVSRMIDDPWAMPGHIDVSSGTLQVQDQASVGFKLPYTGLMGHGAREADPNVQTQEQHSFIISPVSDGDDLRRLHAIYRYAICSDTASFHAAWKRIIQPYAQAVDLANINNPQFLLQSELARDQRKLNKLDGEINEPGNKTPELLQQLKNQRNTLIESMTTLEKLQNNSSGMSPMAAGGGGGNKTGSSQSGDQSQGGGGGQDSIEVERFKGRMIEQILGGPRWLYWRPVNGRTGFSCPLGSPNPTPPLNPGPEWHNLGPYREYELWTNNPEKMSQFMMIAAGSIPNTAGVHNLGSVLSGGSTGSNGSAKAPVFYFKSL